jgi:succinate-semialdehyde dehydrogenase / glutarate-semialdehyde dehydrogenase
VAHLVVIPSTHGYPATSAVTGEILESFDELTSEELEDKLARAGAAAESYRLTSVEQRAV